MSRGRRRSRDDYADDEEDDDYAGAGSKRRRPRSDFIDDVAEETDDEDEEDDGRRRHRKPKNPFIDDEVIVDDDEESSDGEQEDGFIVGEELPDGEDERPRHRDRPFAHPGDEDDEAEMEEILERIRKRGKHMDNEVPEVGDSTEVEMQALLPSVKDPKLWMVKCAIGRERETAICLLQKFSVRPDLQITSVVALDHLKNYIYVEAYKEAHVKEACKGMRSIFGSMPVTLVSIKEMRGVLSVESKAVDIVPGSWVRMKPGNYKGDLGKVVSVDDVRRKVTLKLVPRIDLQAIASKLEGKDVGKKRPFVPPPRLFKIDEARDLGIHVQFAKNRDTGERYVSIDNMLFKDGFLYKTLAMRSISYDNIQPTFDELDKFWKDEDADGDMARLNALLANRKKGHFIKGDSVIVVRGDLINLMGWVQKVEEDIVHIKPQMPGLPKTLAFNEKELCKYFKPGDRVKVVSGVQEGANGMVVKVEGHVLFILSDTTREELRVFADNVVEGIGDFNLQSHGWLPRGPQIERMPRGPQIEPRRRQWGRKEQDSVIGRPIKIHAGPFKGYRGRIKDINGSTVRVELDSQMKNITVKRDEITDTSIPSSESSRCASQTPMHPSQTPVHPFYTPSGDPAETPMRIGMRTPMHDQAWAPMSPASYHWGDGSPATWGTTPHSQPGTPRLQTYEALTPRSRCSPGNSRQSSPPYGNPKSPYIPSTPVVQPMTPRSSLPATPGGHPSTPISIGLNVMSPMIGEEGEGSWFMPDIVVNVSRPGEDSIIGVLREVTTDGYCKVALGLAGDGETVMVMPAELGTLKPKKSDRIKIISGNDRGNTGKLIGIDGSDGIVRVDATSDIKILDLDLLAKLAISV